KNLHMRNFYLLFCFLFISTFSFSQEPFITTWELTEDDLEITIPTTGTGYNYTVDFGDGIIQTNVSGNSSHTYDTAGTYTVTIFGDFPRIFFNYDIINAPKIISVEQWGDIEWLSMQSAFYGCENLVINAIDMPNLSQVTDMGNMFTRCSSLNQSIND